MNYVRIREVMELVDWRWHFEDGARVPTIEELERCVADLVEQSRDFPNSTITCGGFEVYNTGSGTRVSFVLSSLLIEEPNENENQN
jgi:hypothetical protein